jgi:hypothetical protein
MAQQFHLLGNFILAGFGHSKHDSRQEQEMSSRRTRRPSPAAAFKLLIHDGEHALASGREVSHQAAGEVRKFAAVNALASHLGHYERLAQRPLGFLDTAPDVAVAIAEFLSCMLDGPRSLDRPQDFA